MHYPSLLLTFHPDRARQIEVSQAQITAITNTLNQMANDINDIGAQSATLQTTLRSFQGSTAASLSAVLSKVNSDVLDLKSTIARMQSAIQQEASTL
jgi:gas vesicle protein